MRLRPLLALSLLAACGKATFPAARLPEAVRELCLKEQKIDVRARLVGKTLYIACDLEGLVTDDLDFRRDTLETFEGLMLSGTRASLSTDATVDFLVVQAKDPRLKASITILRYIPDIKGLIYMRYSRSDFEDRMVLESDAESTEASTATWHDVDVAEFMARLVASRLQRRLSGNPLVSVMLQIRSIRGRVEGGDLILTLERGDKASTDSPVNAVLETAVQEVASDVLRKYDPQSAEVQRVGLEDDRGTALWDRAATDLLSPSPKPFVSR
jgi:hypothetical protein